jgi:NADPH:quinone reductase-like Zn-dependent oxidoreductase
MRAVHAAATDHDDPLAGLVVGELPEPDVPEGWVRVRITAAGLNWHDIWTLRGVSMWPIEPPVILGTEGAGVLDDGTPVVIHPVMGDPSRHGDETLDPNRNVPSERIGGTFAEYAVVPARNVVPLPAGFDVDSAAVLGTAWLTAYRMLFTKSGLRPGQTMLVQGASGGVATALVQLGHAAGMTVWVTGRTAEKRALAEELGASRTFHTGAELPHQVDAVLDTVGAATWHHSMHAVCTGGTVVTCAATTGDQPGAELRRMIRDQITVRGTYAGNLRELRDLIGFVTARDITPRIGAVLPMTRADEGFRALWQGTTAGKIVLRGW